MFKTIVLQSFDNGNVHVNAPNESVSPCPPSVVFPMDGPSRPKHRPQCFRGTIYFNKNIHIHSNRKRASIVQKKWFRSP